MPVTRDFGEQGKPGVYGQQFCPLAPAPQFGEASLDGRRLRHPVGAIRGIPVAEASHGLPVNATVSGGIGETRGHKLDKSALSRREPPRPYRRFTGCFPLFLHVIRLDAGQAADARQGRKGGGGRTRCPS